MCYENHYNLKYTSTLLEEDKLYSKAEMIIIINGIVCNL